MDTSRKLSMISVFVKTFVGNNKTSGRVNILTGHSTNTEP